MPRRVARSAAVDSCPGASRSPAVASRSGHPRGDHRDAGASLLRRPLAAALVLPLLLAVVVISGLWGFSYDDAFITYRYAERFSEGRGLTYNDGERVYGTSAPGYALVLGSLTRLSRPFGLGPEAWGPITGCAGLLLASLAMLGVHRRTLPERILAATLLGTLLLTQRWLLELLGGEAPVMAGLLILAFVLALELDRPVAAGLSGAVAVCLRPDAVLALGVTAIALWASGRRPPWRYGLAAGAPAAIFYGALTLYYGSPVPHSYLGKQQEMAIAGAGYSAAQWDWLSRCFSPPGAAILIALVLLGCLVGLRGRRSLVLALVAWIVVHELFYRRAGVPFAPWYHVVSLAAAFAVGALGAARVVAPRPRAEGGPAAAARPLERGAALAAAALALLLAGMGARWLAGQWGRPPDPRQNVYTQAGDFLRNLPAGRVAAIEIGVLGHRSRQPILDLVGLVSEEALAAQRVDGVSHLLGERPPRYAVDVPLFAFDYPLSAWLANRRDYREIARFDDSASGRGLVRLLERVEPTIEESRP